MSLECRRSLLAAATCNNVDRVDTALADQYVVDDLFAAPTPVVAERRWFDRLPRLGGRR